ncbi:Glutamate--cysteine ligase [Nymphaea thermarum]|nr:Glutamate--cysteine ligase [Nymphaea thermarum]
MLVDQISSLEGDFVLLDIDISQQNFRARLCDLLVFFVVISPSVFSAPLPRDPRRCLGFSAAALGSVRAVASGSVHAVASGSAPPREVLMALVFNASSHYMCSDILHQRHERTTSYDMAYLEKCGIYRDKFFNTKDGLRNLSCSLRSSGKKPVISFYSFTGRKRLDSTIVAASPPIEDVVVAAEPLTKEDLVSYLSSGCKPKEKWRTLKGPLQSSSPLFTRVAIQTINFVSPEIQPLILRKKTAWDMWVVLKQMYGQKKTAIHTYQVMKTVYNLRQGNSSVAEYYGALKAKWEELDYHSDIPWHCPQDQALHVAQELQNRVFLFLAGLNDEFEGVRSQILNSGEVSSIEDVYSCIEAEKQRRLVTNEGKRDLVPSHEQ